MRHDSFSKASKEDRPPVVSGMNGYIALKIYETALKSANRGKAITIMMKDRAD
jgi:hypothetical protein